MNDALEKAQESDSQVIQQSKELWLEQGIGYL